MKIFSIKKRTGKFRTIYAPNSREKKEFKNKLIEIEKIHVSKYAYAFVKSRNIITNAKQHLNFDISINFDLSNFFDTVTKQHFKNVNIGNETLDFCLVDGAARQGLPTSPLLANVAASKLDYQIAKKLNLLKIKFAYTRYADDLTISLNEKNEIQPIIEIVKKCVKQNNFILNEQKTRVQFATNNNRREICGVTVDSEIHTSCRFRHRLRAAEHNLKFLKDKNEIEKQKEIIRGMKEFALLKEKSIKFASEQ